MATPVESPVKSSGTDSWPPRHALGLPAGSVRALLALGVLGLMWGVALRQQSGETPPLGKKLPLAFVYLQFLMVLILAHFFAAHGSTIGRRVSNWSPLGLPRGSVRLILLAGYLGLAAFLYRTQPKLEFPDSGPFVVMVGLLITGFFAGHVLTGIMRVLGRGRLPDWFVDFQAWVALVSLFGLGALVLIHVFINPTVPEGVKIDIPTLESILGALVGFYFGARS
jgi:hypothetical protein